MAGPIRNPKDGYRDDCPVCNSALRERPRRSQRDSSQYKCPQCGDFQITDEAEIRLPSALDVGRMGNLPQPEVMVAAFSHALRRMQHDDQIPLLDSEAVERILASATLPSAQEQGDNLIRFIGGRTLPGKLLTITSEETGSIIGAASAEGWAFVVRGLNEAALVAYGSHNRFPDFGMVEARLTFEGWARYEELLRGAPSGRRAFMAMPFGVPELDSMLDRAFRPAVAATGFSLVRLDDDAVSRAGLIDDRLRVEIRGAWFLIADLTHENRGAYWEAGFAEGLGKPVIYTCEKSKHTKLSTHFDTNHHLHVLWSLDDIEPAVRKLKATIRATILEAKQNDEEGRQSPRDVQVASPITGTSNQ